MPLNNMLRRNANGLNISYQEIAFFIMSLKVRRRKLKEYEDEERSFLVIYEKQKKIPEAKDRRKEMETT